MSAKAHALRNAVDEPPPGHRVFHVSTTTGPRNEFHEMKELGTAPPPTCKKCSGCLNWTFRRKRLSCEDQDVLARIEATMSIDEKTGIIGGEYPWKPCVGRMTNNIRQAEKIQRSMERHMSQAGTHNDFVQEMDKSILEGKVRLLTQEEMARWHGPVNFITTFAVVKASSISTKTRVVSNSAMKNAMSGLSLNQCMWPGPNTLCDLLNCLIFWRAVELVLMLDLKKAYQAIHTGEMEMHLRRFLYCRSPKDGWMIYTFTRATFSDLARWPRGEWPT